MNDLSTPLTTTGACYANSHTKRVEMKNHRLAWIVSLVALAHVLINIAHGVAHTKLGVTMFRWQDVFLLIVTGLCPLAGAALLWTVRSRLGLLLLAASMAGSLAFGVYYHYIAISPDHVGHLPEGDAQALFRSTALLLPISQVAGLVVAIWGLATTHRQRTP